MPEFIYLLLASIIVMCGNASLVPGIGQPCEVKVGAAESNRLRQYEDSVAEATDGTLVARMLYRKHLSKAELVELEAAALRRLERRKANLARRQRLAEAGGVAFRDLDAS